MSPFEEQAFRIVCAIPPGRVMSYGQLALYAGKPNGAREAGAAMRTLGQATQSSADFPWWRVLNSEGVISIAANPDATAEMQQEFLMHEGVEFKKPFHLDMNRYRWHATEPELKELGLDDWIIASALYKYGTRTTTGDLGL